jgi:hypothetical protein
MLTDFQKSVLDVLRPFRSETTFIGGGSALNLTWARLSDDTDIFNDTRGSLPKSIEQELAAVKKEGFSVEITTQDEWMVEAIIRKYGWETNIQWLDEPETSCRFFPAIEDDALGFRLHQADNAINKVLTAARRTTAARDAVDLVSIVREYCPLGPIVWAIPAKDTDLTPPKIIQSLGRNAFGYADAEISSVRMEGEQITREMVRAVLEPALQQARAYCDERAPQSYLGTLFVNNDDVPVEATQTDVDNMNVTMMTIKNFGVDVKLG